jgi:hypothetical protein
MTVPNKDRQISIRFEPDIPTRAEALITKLRDSAKLRTLSISRAAVLRIALREGLVVLEQRYGLDSEYRAGMG